MKRFSLSSGAKGNVVWSIVVVAFLASAMLALGLTVTASLFLKRVGASSLPLLYVLEAPASLFATALLMQRMRRDQPLRIMKQVLVISLVTIPLTRMLLFWDARPIYFAAYIGMALFDVILYILIMVLTHEYFTLLDAKRHASAISLALAGGGLAGGGLAAVLAQWLSSPDLLFVLLPLILLLSFRLTLLGRRCKAINDAKQITGRDEPPVKELWGSAVRQHPLVAFIGIGVVLDVLLQCIAEYQVYQVYATTFQDERSLTTFLATMNVVMSITGCALSLLVMPRLIKWFGVRWVNVLFPLTTLVSFIALMFHFRLPSAIFAHINYDAGDKHVGAVANTLNYNALPSRIVGRLRVFCDGILYNSALAGSGLLLMALQSSWRQSQISALCVAGGAVFLAVGFLRGRGYVRSLRSLVQEWQPRTSSQLDFKASHAEAMRRRSGQAEAGFDQNAAHPRAAALDEEIMPTSIGDIEEIASIEEATAIWDRVCAHLRRIRPRTNVDAVLSVLQSKDVSRRAKAVELLLLSYSHRELCPILPLLDVLGGQAYSTPQIRPDEKVSHCSTET